MNWFDFPSFLVGLASASIFWWLYTKYRGKIKNVTRVVTQKSEVAARQDIRGLDQLIRVEMHRQAQHQHLACRIAGLNEIFVEPQLIAHPFLEAEQLGDPPIVDQMIPYLPEWNELSGIFDLQGVPLRNLLTTSVNLILVGQFGAGKSSALAYLTSALVQNRTGLKRFEGYLPLLVHINEMNLHGVDVNKPEETVINAFCAVFPKMLRVRIMRHIHSYYKAGKMMIFIDGLDELDAPDFDQAAHYINTLARKSSTVRIITATTPQYLGTLPQQGFFPVALKGWTDREKNRLAQQWISLWNFSLITEDTIEVQALTSLLQNWIENETRTFSPLEWTLRIWSLLSGDALGDTFSADVESYFRRVSNGQISHQAVEALAKAFINLRASSQPQTSLEMMLIKNKFSLQPDPLQQADASIDELHKNRKKGSSGLDILDKLVEIGFLEVNSQANYRFKHPMLLCYFAAFSLIQTPPSWDQLRDWPVGVNAHGLSASFQKEPAWLLDMLAPDSNDLLQKKRWAVSKWLKFVPKDSPWRNDVFKTLVGILQDESAPTPMRYRSLAAILSANDPGVYRLFEKLLNAKSPTVRQLAALGCGALRNKILASQLENTLQDSADVVAYAGMVGIGMMRDKSQLRMLRDYLMGSTDETLRRTAAESLAHLPPEGHDVLKELAESPDIITRRAVVFGLEVVRDDWSQELLKKLSMEDPEWIVRTTATRILESQLDASFAIPRRLTPYTSAEWLLKFAASIGEGISPEIAPVDILLQGLQSDDPDIQWNSLNYLRHIPEKEVIRATMKLYFSSKLSLGTARATDYNLWLYSSAKIE